MRQEEASAVLRLYGLEQALTDEDDPNLWVAAVKRHWPKPEDPKLREMFFEETPRFRFGIGRLPAGEEKPENLSGIVMQEQWSLERVDEEHFRARQGETQYPHYILEISRPSAGTLTAWVHAGDNPAPLIGYGETRAWKRQVDGSWSESDEVIGMWMS